MENLTPEKKIELEERRLFLLKQKKAENNIKHQQQRKLECVACDVCGKVMDKYYYTKHIQSNRHQKNLQIQEGKKTHLKKTA